MESSHQDQQLRDENCLELYCEVFESVGHIDLLFLNASRPQNDFIKQLRKDLKVVGYCAFCDKRRKTDVRLYLPNLNIKTMKQFRVAIVVLSEEFFTCSKRPMIELNECVQAKMSSNNGLEILPLFFGITKAEFNNRVRRKDWEDVWQGFADEDKKGRIDVKKWVHALSVLDGLNGMEYDAAVGEVTYREEVVAAVCKLIPPRFKSDDSHVQSKQKLFEPILRKLDEAGVPLCNGARVVGLYGTLGVGKTTIAKVLVNQKFGEFAGKVCHMELGSLSPMELEEKLLRKLTVLSDVNKQIKRGADGNELQELLMKLVPQKRVFLALDNVQDGNIEEAKKYLGFRYGYGSRILVTSRSLGVLERLGIRDGDCIEMPELDKEGATNLFLYYAGRGLPQPLDWCRLEAIARCVERCRFWKRDIGRETCTPHYHPLALRALGSQLGSVSNDPLQWDKLSKDPLQWDKLSKDHFFNVLREREHSIFRGLRVDYDSLPPREQPIFLDLALNVVPRSAWYSNSVWEWLSSMHGSSRDQIRDSVSSPGLVVSSGGNLNMRAVTEYLEKGLIEDVREDGLLTIKIHDLFVEFAKQEVQDVWGNWPFVFYVGGSDVPESLRIPHWLERPPARLVIRNSNLRSLKEVDSHRIRKAKALQILDCQLLEELDVQGMVELRSLEIFGCPRLGEKFQGLEKLTNLVWLSWKDVPKSVPVTSHLSSLPSLQFVDLGFLSHS